MYNITTFRSTTTTTGLDIIAPAMFVSKTGQFRIIGNGVKKIQKLNKQYLRAI